LQLEGRYYSKGIDIHGYQRLKIIDLDDLVECVFVERDKRFIGRALCDSRETMIHINNTGRLVDILYKGSKILCTRIRGKKTSLRVIGSHVHNDKWTLIDTKLQERAFMIAVENDLISWLQGYRIYRRDIDIGGTKIDFLLRKDNEEAVAELKSAVYFHQADMSARYPDTISLRGRKHIEILASSRYRNRYLVFVAGHPLARIFGPSSVDPLLPSLLRKASRAGVNIKAIKLYIDREAIILSDPDLPTTFSPP
jgi:sugar fermentation stimulation protein A